MGQTISANGKIVFTLVDLVNVLKLCDRVQLHPHAVAVSAALINNKNFLFQRQKVPSALTGYNSTRTE